MGLNTIFRIKTRLKTTKLFHYNLSWINFNASYDFFCKWRIDVTMIDIISYFWSLNGLKVFPFIIDFCLRRQPTSRLIYILFHFHILNIISRCFPMHIFKQKWNIFVVVQNYPYKTEIWCVIKNTSI
jgi:hypothetical protein